MTKVKPLEGLPAKIMEDDRYQIELPSKVNWKEFVPKLRERQLHELEPAALELIHQTYINLIDLTDIIHVFTVSQFLQLLSIYLPFLSLFYGTVSSGYLYCRSRFKCKSVISVKVDEEKGLFYLRYVSPPVHGHTGTEIVEMTKVKPLEGLPAKIMEDDRYQIELPSKVNWKEFVPKLRERQLHELEPAALELIHQTYINLIDLTDIIHVFTVSQFLQLLSIYLPFLRFRCSSKSSGYFLCPSQFKCESRISVKVDEEKRLFYLRYVSPPVHGHTGTEIVEMAKVSLSWESLPVKIVEDDRFQLELPSKVNWKEFVPKLRERQRHELEPTALELIHQTYINLIDLTDKIHVFTVSQFLQFLSIYLPFLSLVYATGSSGYLYCRDRFKCESRISVTVNEEKGLFYLRYVSPPVHGHNGTEIVERAKVSLSWESLPAKIMEDDRFQLELPSKVNWKEFVRKLRERQLHELEPAALELIHQTYINLIDLTATIHVFTVSQFLQLLSIYLPFLRLNYTSERSAYFSCTSRFKCKSRISVTVDEEKRLFYLRYVSPPVHGHTDSNLRYHRKSTGKSLCQS
ncbi:unnamed protein product [Ambrosiozyma monospora]|uniref:Unnamed protein product n=1 Tax=Ambrosiozyma monospora TaxID=43982 RepID=A0A9W6Z508_AMBMO|nr:unnamed protein product [Ambrosiozyma monospora]